MGRRAYDRLAGICATLNMSEQQLSHSLGISRVALKAIDRSDAPLYLRLALAALLADMNPNDVFKSSELSGRIKSGSPLLNAS
nr:hypothetical protein [Ochrobactrum sp. CM-21-5]